MSGRAKWWSGFAALELHAQVGVGPNPDLAFLAARKARPVLVVQTPTAFLAQLALTEIDPPPHLQALCATGAFTRSGS